MKTHVDRIVVLGAAGMLGRMLFGALQGSARLVGVSRGASDVQIDAEHGDAGLRHLLAQHPGAMVINAVGHLATQLASADAGVVASGISVNAVFPHRLAAVAKNFDQRVVHISTDAVFADSVGLVDEDATPCPADIYGRSKLLGEPDATNTITLRCSIIGPNPDRASGLWQWLADQPPGATVDGFTNHLWSGVTTRQVADLCAHLSDRKVFETVRSEGAVHHFAPNPTLTKYQLLCHLRDVLRQDLEVRATLGPTDRNRLLTSRRQAISELYKSSQDWPAIIAAGSLPDQCH